MQNAPRPYLIAVFVCLTACIQAPFALQAPADEPAAAPPTPAAAPIDFGDFAPTTLRTKASAALDAKNYDAAIIYANKCIEAFGDPAAAQQAALKALPTDKDEIYKQWALNEVGTSYLIKGEALQAQNKKKEATEAFKTLVDKFAFAQCWDTGGWFWTPADKAKELLASLASS